MTSLREILSHITLEYNAAKQGPQKGHPIAGLLRNEATDSVRQALGQNAGFYKVVGSPGKGNWAAVPWISVFDPDITTSATRGYYVVYLINPTEKNYRVISKSGRYSRSR